MVAWIVRLLFVALAFLMGLIIRFQVFESGAQPRPDSALRNVYHLLLPALAGLLVVVELTFRKRYLGNIVTVFFGLMLGIFISSLIGLFMYLLFPPGSKESMAETVAAQIMPVVTLMVCYVTISVVFQTRDHFRFIIPYLDLSHQGRPKGGIVLDTSVLIDGRVADLAGSHVFDAPLLIPGFVLKELQAVADSEERSRRNRGRRGLEVVNRLQQNPAVTVRVVERDFPDMGTVDRKLIAFAQEADTKLMTCDYNLSKVAEIEKVVAINLNELASACRTVALPGEELMVDILKPGEGGGQGVGFLEDGTMVVVEGARKDTGRRVTSVVTNVRQTSAGRLVFARKIRAVEEGKGEKKAADTDA